VPLAPWINFYVIAGSSAGALTGLQFVVIALITQAEATGSVLEIRAFGTPTVVHFCVALLISGIMSVPWHSLVSLSYCLAACAVAGFAYSLRVLFHAKKAAYKPDLEDWFWYAALPLIAYAALMTAAVLLWSHPVESLFMIAAITLVFLFAGIHNAWDTVTYVALKQVRKPE
jgi:hypothetical protein